MRARARLLQAQMSACAIVACGRVHAPSSGVGQTTAEHEMRLQDHSRVFHACLPRVSTWPPSSGVRTRLLQALGRTTSCMQSMTGNCRLTVGTFKLASCRCTFTSPTGRRYACFSGYVRGAYVPARRWHRYYSTPPISGGDSMYAETPLAPRRCCSSTHACNGEPLIGPFSFASASRPPRSLPPRSLPPPFPPPSVCSSWRGRQ